MTPNIYLKIELGFQLSMLDVLSTYRRKEDVYNDIARDSIRLFIQHLLTLNRYNTSKVCLNALDKYHGHWFNEPLVKTTIGELIYKLENYTNHTTVIEEETFSTSFSIDSKNFTDSKHDYFITKKEIFIIYSALDDESVLKEVVLLPEYIIDEAISITSAICRKSSFKIRERINTLMIFNKKINSHYIKTTKDALDI